MSMSDHYSYKVLHFEALIPKLFIYKILLNLLYQIYEQYHVVLKYEFIFLLLQSVLFRN